jgi:hypothetical protein
MSWLTIRPRPVLLNAFRGEGQPASAVAFGMSAPKARQICSLGREPQEGHTRNELAAKRRQTLRKSLSPVPGLTGLSVCSPGAHAPGYESDAASRLDGFRPVPFLGLTPLAMDPTPLSSWAIAVLATRGSENHSLGLRVSQECGLM